MLPLIPLAISLVPQLARWLAGPTAGDTAAAVAAVVKTATGTTDPVAARDAVKSDPLLTARLSVQLAQIAAAREAEADQARQAELVAALGDVAGARGQTVSLATQRSAIAWGAPIVSAVVLTTFGAMLACLMTFEIPQSALALANIMLGSLATMASSVVAYWVGSSAGSKAKDEVISQAQIALANSTPAKP